MRRNLDLLERGEFDLVVIGGGAFGCCAAWEAASRGLRVALLERSDFGGATSANHLRMIHGGIRYLQHLDLRRVRESCEERSILLRIAPHLARPIGIVMPTYGRGMQGRAVLGAGLRLYDLLTLGKNAGIADPARRVPRGRILSRREVLHRYPDLEGETLTGAGLFYDGQFYHPPRLAWSFLRTAMRAGAVAANHVEVTGFLRDGPRVRGVAARDRLGSATYEVRAGMVLNAAGPWAPQLLHSGLGAELRPRPRFSRDAGLAVPGRIIGDLALACQVGTRDPDALLSRQGRHVFLVPWRDHTLIGVWHRVYDGPPDEASVDDAEVRAWVAEVNATYPHLGLRPEGVSMVYSGLTLFGENDPDAKDLSFGKRNTLVDHAAEHGLDGVTTLIGVRATMARRAAVEAIDLVAAKLGREIGPSCSHRQPLAGGDIADFGALLEEAREQHGLTAGVAEELVHDHGTEYRDVLDYLEEDPTLGAALSGTTTMRAEVVHAVREEMACTLGDVVFGRTGLGSGGSPGPPALEEAVQLVGTELGWDEPRRAVELEAVHERFPRPSGAPA